MYLKTGFALATVVTGVLFVLFWMELERLRQSIQKQAELTIRQLNNLENELKEDFCGRIREETIANNERIEKRLQAMSEEITTKITELDKGLEEIARNIDSVATAKDSELSLVSQLNNLINYSLKDGEK